MRINRFSVLSIAALVALLSAFVAAPAAVSAQQADDHDDEFMNVFDLEFTGVTDEGATFEGTFSIDEFVDVRGELYAVGTLTGELTPVNGENGTRGEEIDEDGVMIPLSTEGFGEEGVCGDLSLVAGPADVELGDPQNGDNGDNGQPEVLQVDTVLHLDPVSFDVTTDVGFGGLFGTILCNFAGLFEEDMDAASLANLLNLIMRLS